jgi:hypothetical protein
MSDANNYHKLLEPPKNPRNNKNISGKFWTKDIITKLIIQKKMPLEF